MPRFHYSPEILKNYPELCTAIIYANRISNQPTAPELAKLFQNVQAGTIAALRDTPLSEIESLAAWRSVFRSFGVNPTRYRSAPEALLRRLLKKGEIPSINCLVDICNLVSIRYALPVAAFDLASINEPIVVRYAAGDELFKPLGEEAEEHPEPGEVIFLDSESQVVARRWCWRQSAWSAASMDTHEVILTIESMHENGLADVSNACQDILALVEKFFGVTCTSDIIGCSMK